MGDTFDSQKPTGTATNVVAIIGNSIAAIIFSMLNRL
jgi:hypothetical protein